MEAKKLGCVKSKHYLLAYNDNIPQALRLPLLFCIYRYLHGNDFHVANVHQGLDLSILFVGNLCSKPLQNFEPPDTPVA